MLSTKLVSQVTVVSSISVAELSRPNKVDRNKKSSKTRMSCEDVTSSEARVILFL